jgi:hypothetical protein
MYPIAKQIGTTHEPSYTFRQSKDSCLIYYLELFSEGAPQTKRKLSLKEKKMNPTQILKTKKLF